MSEDESILMGSDGMSKDYLRYSSLKVLFIAAMAVLMVLLAGLSITIGTHEIGFRHVYELIWNHLNGVTYEAGSADAYDDLLIWEERLPRVLAAVFAGMSLAVAGAAMQSLLNNPLADPYTTGISSGAMVGVSTGLVLGIALPMVPSEFSLMVNAFVCSLVPALVIVALSRFKNTSPVTIVLAGLAMGFMFGAVTQLIMVGATATVSQEVYKWMAGTLNYVVSPQIPLMAVLTLAGCVFFIVVSNKLNLFALGETAAKSLGLDTRSFMNVCLLVMAVMIAEETSVTGVLGFVGLVIPHIVRSFIGGDNRYVVPASMFMGACLVILSDIIARVWLSSIAVGVVLSFIGGPMFLAIIIRSRRGLW